MFINEGKSENEAWEISEEQEGAQKKRDFSD